MKSRFYEEAKHAGVRSLDELNKFWFAWLTREYHHAEHSALKMTPIERWRQDEEAGFVQWVSTEQIRRALMIRDTRKVHIRTGTIRLNNRCYQLKPESAGQKVEVLYEANKPCEPVEIWKDGKLIEIAREIVPGANIDFSRRRKRQKENEHLTFGSSRDYKLALMAAHQNEAPVEVSEYMAQPEFVALAERLLERDFKEEERDYLSCFFFENSPMTGHRVEVLIGQAVSAKGNKLHLRSYCEHLKEGLRQQRR